MRLRSECGSTPATCSRAEYRGAILIARHGSWNRTKKFGGDIAIAKLNNSLKGRLEPKTSSDRLSCFALLDLDFVRFAGIHRPTLLRSALTDVFGASHSPSFDQRRRPETLRAATATAFAGWPPAADGWSEPAEVQTATDPDLQGDFDKMQGTRR
jgi:hypothetical protein